jgi:hypothetical protein
LLLDLFAVSLVGGVAVDNVGQGVGVALEIRLGQQVLGDRRIERGCARGQGRGSRQAEARQIGGTDRPVGKHLVAQAVEGGALAA